MALLAYVHQSAPAGGCATATPDASPHRSPPAPEASATAPSAGLYDSLSDLGGSALGCA
jgi:hypothetical protein